MANAPSHAQNAATKMVTIYNEDGETLEVSRLNALDLIRGGNYFWKAEDINNEHPEADGPKDPAAKEQTIYNADSESFTVSMANARDMVGTGNYFWNPPAGTKKDDAPAENASTNTVTEPAAPVEPTSTPTADADVVPSEEGLSEQALRVTGNDDVIAYLEGFAEPALRNMAFERYGEKLHHRASKETLITKIVELEDERTVGTSHD